MGGAVGWHPWPQPATCQSKPLCSSCDNQTFSRCHQMSQRGRGTLLEHHWLGARPGDTAAFLGCSQRGEWGEGSWKAEGLPGGGRGAPRPPAWPRRRARRPQPVRLPPPPLTGLCVRSWKEMPPADPPEWTSQNEHPLRKLWSSVLLLIFGSSLGGVGGTEAAQLPSKTQVFKVCCTVTRQAVQCRFPSLGARECESVGLGWGPGVSILPVTLETLDVSDRGPYFEKRCSVSQSH